MEVAMLWFDNDPRTLLNTMVSRAAKYYLEKYGQDPNLCLVHPSMLNGNPPLEAGRAGNIIIRTKSNVLAGHLWIGTEAKN